MAGCACCGGKLLLGRRGLLAGAAGLLATGAVAEEAPWRIDVHHHVSPPTWVAALKRAGLDLPPINDWTPEASLAAMDRAGIATSVLSPTSPQVSFLPADEAARVARESNEDVAGLCRAHPGRFGMFATLPLPHVEASLAEIAHALDVLHADGIGILTSYGGKWLGDPAFAPVFDELNRRRAVVYTHPTGANCCVNLVPSVPDQTIEWGADTTRSIANLIFSGASARYKDIAFIFSHGGGVLTAVAERFLVYVPSGSKGRITREAVSHELSRFYYDTAQVANEGALEVLAKLVPLTQVVFGTDYPFRPPLEDVEGLAKLFDAGVQRQIGRENALQLLPRLRGT